MNTNMTNDDPITRYRDRYPVLAQALSPEQPLSTRFLGLMVALHWEARNVGEAMSIMLTGSSRHADDRLLRLVGMQSLVLLDWDVLAGIPAIEE